VLRVAVVPAEVCPPVNATAARRAIDGAAAWLVRGQGADGRFLYGYFSDRNEASPLYGTTRHSGALDILYRLGRVEAADAGLAYARDNLVEHDGWTAFAPAGEDASAGANALLLASLMHRRQATGSRRYDELSHRIARFLLEQIRPDGSVLLYWRPSTERPVPGEFGPYSTGETFWALTLMRDAFPSEGWERPARRVADYLATRRDAAEGYTVMQSDHWAAYGLAELARVGLTDREVAYAHRLAGHFGAEVRFESQHKIGLLDSYSRSGAELGTIGEGTAALWRLAGVDPRLAGDRADLGRRVTCVAGMLVDRQDPLNDPNPRQRGAWFADHYTQMDDQQHAAGALLGAVEVLG
jgi:hypothetical protein